MTVAEQPETALIEELRAVLAGLEHARRQLAAGDVVDMKTLQPRLEACARRLDVLDQTARKDIRPIMLALLDELTRTIAAFDVEHRVLGDKLRSASRSMTAGAAYRQAGAR